MKLRNMGHGLVQNDNVDVSNTVVMDSMVYQPMQNKLTFYFTVIGSHHRGFAAQVSFNAVKEVKNIKSRDEAERYLENPKYMMTKDKGGSNHIVEKPRGTLNSVEVRCTCESYRFTYAYANRRNRALFPPDFPIYVRKTPVRGGRPRRNPYKIPGLCKHLVLVAEYLVDNDYVI